MSFSGGKDSRVLVDIVRSQYNDVELLYIDTGLEFPEIKKYVKEFDNLTVVRPRMSFVEVLKRYGYPMISKEVSDKVYCARNKPDGKVAQRFVKNNEHDTKHNGFSVVKYEPLLHMNFNISRRCCDVMKKQPAYNFERTKGKKPIIATMAVESDVRRSVWLKEGCNAFNNKRPICKPMSFWTEQDVLQYAYEKNIKLAEPYGEIVFENGKYFTTGYERTGCIYCGFGAHINDCRFERLKNTHPKLYEYCMNGGEFVNGIWQPSNDGLGLKYVIDELNKVYGENFIKY